MIRARAFCVVLCILLSQLASGQEQTKPETEKREAEKQAFEMIESIAANIPNLRSADNRIYLASAIADLLWNKDETRARALYETLTGEVAGVMANLNPADQRSHNTLGVIQQQRREIIERMVQRDPEMALSFLRATRPPTGMRSRGNEYTSEMNLELHLAGFIAQKDPDQALRIVRANLRKGVTYSAVSVLLNLYSKSPEAARTLHGEIVEKLRSMDLLSDYEASNAAWGLLNSFQPPQASEDNYRSLVELMLTTVLSAKTDAGRNSSIVQNVSSQLPSFITQIEKYAPGQVGALKQWSQQSKRNQDPANRVYQELQEAMQQGTVEELLALAGKYGPDYHAQIYQQASQKAIANGDVNRGRQIITEFIPEGPQRVQMLEQLENQLFWTSLNENKTTEALQVLNRVKGTEQRFQLLISLITNVINRGEKTQAISLLTEATALIQSLPRSSQKLSAQLQLAQCYATVDPKQSVALILPIIVLVNQLVEAAAVLDGFENSYLNEGEWMKRAHTNLGNMVNTIGQNLGTLAAVDSEGARSLSNQLQRPEIRLMAQLEIAQSLLRKGSVQHSNYSRINFSTLRR